MYVCKTALWFVFLFRFLTNVAGVFALSSFLSPTSAVFEKIRRDFELNKDKQFPPLWMWHGDVDTNRLRWASHTAENFTDLEIKTDFLMNFSRQGHEILPVELFYLKEWVEKIIPNPEQGNQWVFKLFLSMNKFTRQNFVCATSFKTLMSLLF